MPDDADTALVAEVRPPKVNVPLVVGAVGAMAFLTVGISAIFVSGSSSKKEASKVDAAYELMVAERAPYYERLTRTDTNPVSLTNPGWRQQAVALMANVILENVESQRTTPGTDNYRLSRQALLQKAIVNANEVALLAELGQTAVLEYQNGGGKKIRVPVSSPELAAIAYNKLEAIDLAYNLQTVPQFDLAAINTEIGNFQQPYKLRQSDYLKAQNLGDAAQEVKNIQLWREKPVKASNN